MEQKWADAGVESPNTKTHRRDSSAVISCDDSQADSHLPETYVIDLAELRQIIWEMQERQDADATSSEIQK